MKGPSQRKKKEKRKKIKDKVLGAHAPHLKKKRKRGSASGQEKEKWGEWRFFIFFHTKIMIHEDLTVQTQIRF
jgi:hypothetical protein